MNLFLSFMVLFKLVWIILFHLTSGWFIPVLGDDMEESLQGAQWKEKTQEQAYPFLPTLDVAMRLSPCDWSRLVRCLLLVQSLVNRCGLAAIAPLPTLEETSMLVSINGYPKCAPSWTSSPAEFWNNTSPSHTLTRTSWEIPQWESLSQVQSTHKTMTDNNKLF